MKVKLLQAFFVWAVLFSPAGLQATERFFTYTYEPETMLKGVLEYEQWLTLRAGRNSTVTVPSFRTCATPDIMSIDTEEGRGSRFWFTLRVAGPV